MKNYMSVITRNICVFMQTILCALDKKVPVVINAMWGDVHPVYKNSDYGVASAIPGMLVTDGYYIPEVGIKVLKRSIRELMYNYNPKLEIHITSAVDRLLSNDELNFLIDWKLLMLKLSGYKRAVPYYDDVLKVDSMMLKRGYPIKILASITRKQIDAIVSHPDTKHFSQSMELLRTRLGVLAEYQINIDNSNSSSANISSLTDYIKRIDTVKHA